MAVVFANRNDFTATEMFNPNSLYTSCIGAISKSYKYLNSEFYIYPPDIHFDILHGVSIFYFSVHFEIFSIIFTVITYLFM